MAHPLLINVIELLRRPGSHRRLDVDVTLDELALVDVRLVPTLPVEVRLNLDGLSDGVVVDGVITSHWHGLCRRCLQPVAGATHSEVHERYQPELRLSDPEAFPIVDDQLDLRQMVAEVVVLDTPHAPLCRDDCAGLCLVCGVDRNEEPCTCVVEVSDPRWSALDQFKGN